MGAVNATYPPVAEDAGKRLGALMQLKPASAPLVLHLYTAYSGNAASDVNNPALDREIARYEANGLQIELTLTFRPSGTDAGANTAGFVSFVRAIVDRYGSDRHFVALQVTDEVNVTGAPGASDGAYPGAQDALIEGVIAAKDEAIQRGFEQLKVGFNCVSAGGGSCAASKMLRIPVPRTARGHAAFVSIRIGAQSLRRHTGRARSWMRLAGVPAGIARMTITWYSPRGHHRTQHRAEHVC